MSWKTEVYTGTWNHSAVRLATKEEAEAYGRELLSRWTLPTASRAVDTGDDPVNSRFDFEANALIHLPAPI